MSATRTPGSWRSCVWDPMERPHVHADQEGQVVCGPNYDLPITPADAHLMAAAPDLLEACKAALAEFGDPEEADPATDPLVHKLSGGHRQGRAMSNYKLILDIDRPYRTDRRTHRNDSTIQNLVREMRKVTEG